MKRTLRNEQFFTSPDNVDFCLSKLGDLSIYTSIIEPSAGDGAFSNKIKNCIAMDLEPLNSNITKQNYLEYNPSKDTLGNNILVIGNPPFGRQSSLAIKFINKSATYANKIAFVLAKSFKKESMISRLDKHVFLVDVFDLPNNNFYFNQTTFDIPCSFFIFEVRNEEREPFKIYETDDFTFVKNKEDADNTIRRVGFYAGKIESVDASPSSHYYIKWNTDTAKETFSKLIFNHNDTVGARSISKNEMIKYYLLKKEEDK